MVSVTSTGFIGVLSAYIVVALLLLSFNIGPRWAWWVKATGIIVTTAFFVVSYYAIIDLMGWPVKARMPAHFQLLWAKVNEPDKLINTPGSVFLWVEELDSNNIPMGTPRAFRLPYTVPLDEGVNEALGRISDGEQISGEARDAEQNNEAADDPDLMAELQERLDDAGYADADELVVDDQILSFQELGLVQLPNKDFGG